MDTEKKKKYISFRLLWIIKSRSVKIIWQVNDGDSHILSNNSWNMSVPFVCVWGNNPKRNNVDVEKRILDITLGWCSMVMGLYTELVVGTSDLAATWRVYFILLHFFPPSSYCFSFGTFLSYFGCFVCWRPYSRLYSGRMVALSPVSLSLPGHWQCHPSIFPLLAFSLFIL